MAYTTINQLPEKALDDLLGSEYLLLSDPNTSYKVKLETINQMLIDLSAGTYQELTNKVIDDVSNYVHANAIHFIAQAVQDIPKGTPVKLVEDVLSEIPHVDIATSADDTIIGICEDGILATEIGEIMVMGILEYDTTDFVEGEIIYYQDGLVTNDPDVTAVSQAIAYVIDVNTQGKILVTNATNNVLAANVIYDNTTSELAATSAQDAIDEVAARKVVTTGRLAIIEDRMTLPSKAIGGIFNNSAWVYDDPINEYFTEYSCSISTDGLEVVFEAVDNLSGKYCEVSYLSEV